MIELKTQYPYIDEQGKEHPNLIKHYAIDENNVKYKIIKTGETFPYTEAIDVYPCRFIYEITGQLVEEEPVE